MIFGWVGDKLKVMAEEFPQEPSPESIDQEIERLVGFLYGEEYSDMWQNFPELQEEWYWIEQEAGVALDRQAAKEHLEQFIEKLDSLKK